MTSKNKFTAEQLARLTPEELAELRDITRRLKDLKKRKRELPVRHGTPISTATPAPAMTNSQILGPAPSMTAQTSAGVLELDDDEDDVPVDPNAMPDSAFLQHLKIRAEEIDRDERERKRLHRRGADYQGREVWQIAMQRYGRLLTGSRMSPQKFLNLYLEQPR